MDGQRVDVDKPFSNGMMYPHDYNERCTTLAIIDNEDPSGLRTGRNPATGEIEIMSYKTFPEWAKENGLKTSKYGELYN
jgi:uncharacterized protein with gpF-like domain